MEYSRLELRRARKRCDDSLLFFTRFFFALLRGTKFIVSDHHEVICNELTRIENYELELLNINIPPRFSKTELAAVNFIARGIGMNPTSNWLYITASDELRSQTSISIRDIVSHPYFKIMYGVDLKKDQNSKNLWRTTQGGGLKTATIFGQVTGFGAGQMIEHNDDLEDYVRTFEGCQVWDDINKIDDADQENANNDKVTRVIFNTLLSRKNSADTPIINIQQRAGLTDATEQMMIHYGDNPRAKFMIMPVISNGVPLWEWKLNLEKINELATSPKTKHTFETQYMQNPQPKEGLIFARSELKYYDELPPKDKWEVKLGYSDPADEGVDNHSLPIAVICNGLIYITDAMFTQLNLSLAEPIVLSKIDEWSLDKLYVESNNHGAPWIRDLRQKTKVPVFGIRNAVKKMSRMIAQEGYIKEHFRFRQDFLPESEYDQFMQQIWRILKDGTVKKDDAPDSIAGLAFMIRRDYDSLISNKNN